MKKAIKGATEVLNLYQNLTVKNYTTALILAAGAFVCYSQSAVFRKRRKT